MCVQPKGVIGRFLYPLSVFLVIGGLYAVYMIINIIPQIQRHFLKPQERLDDPHVVHSSMAEVIGVMVGFHMLLFLFLLSYFRTMFTSPGHIPETSFWKEGDFVILERHNAIIRNLINDYDAVIDEEAMSVVRSLPVVERREDSGKFRYCKMCSSFKPDRTHHCTICGKCVLRMDHHCPWLNNCVGYRNYKYFMQVLFWIDLLLLYVIGSSLPRFINVFSPSFSSGTFMKYDLPIIIAFLITVFLAGALLGFTYYHVTLISRALTTIEAKEKVPSANISIRRRWRVANLKFNLDSTYMNFRHTLGSTYGWLLPFDLNNATEDAGTYRYGPWMNIDNQSGGKKNKNTTSNGAYYNID